MVKIVLSGLLFCLTFAEVNSTSSNIVNDEEGKIKATISKDKNGYIITCGDGYKNVSENEHYETEADALDAVENECEIKE